MLPKNRFLILFVLLALLVSACQPLTPSAPAAVQAEAAVEKPVAETPLAEKLPAQVLIITDGIATWDQGMAEHLKGMVKASAIVPAFHAEYILNQDVTMTDSLRKKLDERAWDAILLAFFGDETWGFDEAKLTELAQAVAAEAGSETRLILMTPWLHQGLMADQYDSIAAAFERIAASVNAEQSPVGQAWLRMIEETPDIAVYRPLESFTDLDYEAGLEPAIQGTYLTTAVIYDTLFGRSTAGLNYHPHELIPDLPKFQARRAAWMITDEEFAVLDRVAWEMVTNNLARP